MANDIIKAKIKDSSDYKIKVKTDGVTVQSQTPVSIRGTTYEIKNLADLADVNEVDLGDGAIIVYDADTKTFNITTDFTVPGTIKELVAGAGLTGGGIGASVQIDIGEGNGIVVSNNAIAVKAGSSIIANSSGIFVKDDLELNTLSLNEALDTISGGTGFTSYNTGDLLVGQGNTLSILSIGDGILQANGTQLYYSEIIDEGEF